jgi:hypothetical protein
MEDECRAILDSSDKTFEEMNDEIISLQMKNLKSIKYTGTPENIKEIESLVSSWDYKEVVYKRQSRDSIPSFNHLFYKKSNFSPISYIIFNSLFHSFFCKLFHKTYHNVSPWLSG